VSRKTSSKVELFADHRKIAEAAVKAALKAGATDADAYAACGRETKIKIRTQEVEELTQAGSKAMGLRVLVDGRSASLHTSDFRLPAVKALAREAVALARHSGEDEYAGIPASKAGPKRDPLARMDLFDPSLVGEPMEAKIDRARRCEAAAEAVSKKIKNTQGTGYSEGMSAVVLASSNGFVGRYQGSWCSLSTVPIAVKGKERQTDYWSSVARHLEDLESPEVVGRIAAERSLARLGGSVPDTGEMPVVFEPTAAATILSHFVSACYGSAVYREASYLRDQLRQQVAPKHVTIVDDPLMVRGLRSHPFDGEGLPAKKNVILEKGRLERFLTDSYAARKLKRPLTHSATRSTAGGPGVGTSNVYLEPGVHSPTEILASVDKGVYVHHRGQPEGHAGGSGHGGRRPGPHPPRHGCADDQDRQDDDRREVGTGRAFSRAASAASAAILR
jgi:PmbA protein